MRTDLRVASCVFALMGVGLLCAVLLGFRPWVVGARNEVS